MCDKIVEMYPYMLFEKDSIGKSALDYATEDIGGYGSFQVARDIFFSMCLKYTALPDKCWRKFKGIVPSLTKSFGAILSRSEKEAAWAFEFLPRKEREYIQSLLLLHIDVPNDLKTGIIAKCYKTT
jgi:hypothetical protein